MPPQGNARRAIRPFYRTQPEVHYKKSKKNVQRNQQAWFILTFSKLLVGLKAASQHLRNLVTRQLYNAKKQCKNGDGRSKDEIFDLLELLKLH